MDKQIDWRTVEGEPIPIQVLSTGEARRPARALVVGERDAKGRSKGNFRSEIPAGTLRPWLSSNGYLVVSFMVDRKTYKRYVHRLVAKTFVPGWFEGATVDHVDGNRLNNCAENLQWVSLSENSKRQNAAGRGVPKGQAHPGAKLKDTDVPEIHRLRDQGLSYEKIGAALGVSGSLIHKIVTGKRRVAIQAS